jgi:SAM-dependent methyltransferase
MKTTNLQTPNNSNYAALGKENLWLIETSLPNYNKHIIKTLSYQSQRNDEVLDFGAGVGTLAKIWASVTGGKTPDCLEIDPEYAAILKGQGFNTYQSIKEIDKKYDRIYSSNVLEHIENDQQAIIDLYSLLKPGGYLSIYVPALMMLYSADDSAVGHYRRYEKSELIEKVSNAKFDVISCHYCDSIGFFGWLHAKYKKKTEGPMSESTLNLYDRFLFPISKILDACGLKYIFGKNLIITARAPISRG